MALFRDSPEFASTIDAAADRLGIPATAIEKDYWVSQLLRILGQRFPEDFLFKGGTSLSKAYSIVQRFSDDVDILIIPRGRGKGALDTLMKAMNLAAIDALGGPSIAEDSGRGIHRTYRIEYPARHPGTQVIPTSIKLEMGIRGGPQPTEDLPIRSLLGDLIAETAANLEDYTDLAQFAVSVLHPGRTLLEKLVMMHIKGQKLQATPPAVLGPTEGRHFYDIHQLLADQGVLDLLSDRGEVTRIIEDVDQVTRTWFEKDNPDLEVRPTDGFASSPVFNETGSISKQFQEAYESTMPELYFGTDPLPTWSEICTRVGECHDLL